MEALFQRVSPTFGFNLKLKKTPSKTNKSSLQIFAFSYQKFIQFAIEETQKHVHLIASPLQEKYSVMKSMDGTAELQMKSFHAPKIRYLRSLSIQSSDEMQVLDFAVFPEPEYDLPIFCANFFTAGNMNIIVMDLNPLHDVIVHTDYKEKYYKSLMPLGVKYVEIFPWGGKLTSESLRFFSPIVIWTKFTSSQHNHDTLFSAFVEYYKAWLELMNQAVTEENGSQLLVNCEAQHKYLTWRTEKDPGHQVLKRLVGEIASKDVVRNFLFSGVGTLGNKTFLDYFPEYRCEDGTINQKRSVIGKSFQIRPWDTGGEFIGNKMSIED